MPKVPSKPAAKKPAAKPASKAAAKPVARSAAKPSKARAPKPADLKSKPGEQHGHRVAKKGPVGPIPPQPVLPGKKSLLEKMGDFVSGLKPGKGKAKK